MTKPLNIIAVGDVSFRGPNEETPQADLFDSVSPILKNADLSMANLESPLVDNEQPVPNKCTLRGTVGWARIIRNSGIHFVSLANNHMMDYGVAGLQSTIDACAEAGLYFAGAGENIREASRPAYITCNGIKVAILCRTSVIVGSPSYAADTLPGVAYLDTDETINAISNCRKEADVVILSIHWGVEHYEYPSKRQRTLAKQFTEAGADLIIGHHPHVLQGIERLDKAFVIYSIGNFTFDEFDWSFINEDGILQVSRDELLPVHRLAGIAEIRFADGHTTDLVFHPSIINTGGIVQIDDRTERRRRIEQLSSTLTWPKLLYYLFWILYSMKQEWILRINPLFAGKFTLEKMKKLRFAHVKQFMKKIIRSGRISLGKTTSPYD